MKKRHSLLRVLILLAILTCGHALTSSAQKDVYKFVVKDGKGKEVKLKKYKGSVLLIVNTATRCGFTPQYADLQRLYEQYHAQGFEILDFPCNRLATRPLAITRPSMLSARPTMASLSPSFRR